jgi:hypothetical protein
MYVDKEGTALNVLKSIYGYVTHVLCTMYYVLVLSRHTYTRIIYTHTYIYTYIYYILIYYTHIYTHTHIYIHTNILHTYIHTHTTTYPISTVHQFVEQNHASFDRKPEPGTYIPIKPTSSMLYLPIKPTI